MVRCLLVLLPYQVMGSSARSSTAPRRPRVGGQLALPLEPPRRWGGRRAGAGRKPNGARAGVAHEARPALSRNHPVHVTLRVVRGLPNLRHRKQRKAIFGAFAKGKERFGFRLVHFSVQHDHVHLVVEAEGERSLTRGMQGLTIRVARALNRKLERQGRVFADRYHAHTLKTPREVRNALGYVLKNDTKHGAALEGQSSLGASAYRRGPGGRVPLRVSLDPCSSAVVFDGWAGLTGSSPDGSSLASSGSSPDGSSLALDFREAAEELRVDGAWVVAAATSWLLRTGWRRGGLLDPRHRPGPRRPAAQ